MLPECVCVPLGLPTFFLLLCHGCIGFPFSYPVDLCLLSTGV